MIATITLASGRETIIDAEDFEKTHSVQIHRNLFWVGKPSSLKWKESRRAHTSYAVSNVFSKWEVRLHRLVMDAREGQIVDHDNHNGLDNTKQNLRVTTLSGNARNRKPTSGKKYKGTYFHPAQERWHAHIRVDGKKQHLGTYKTEIEAAIAYDEAALIHFGEFAELNRPLETA